MAVRALIIAIQEYPNAAGMARKLEGTLQAGLDFREWLLAKVAAQKLDEGAQILFCSEPKQPGGLGATRNDIIVAVNELKLAGRGQTEELFFFFSGHGFAFVEKPGGRADHIITADYRNNVVSGHCCLNLDQIVSWFRDHLGPGHHYYFVDACRNPLNGNQVTPGSLLPFDPEASPDASTFILQSTVDGAIATVGDAFPRTLLAGMRGAGKAKVWDMKLANDAMFVRYDSLRRFVRAALEAKQPITSSVAGPDGESDVVFARIQPVPNINCKIEIEGCAPEDQCAVVVKRGRSPAEPPLALSGHSSLLVLPPDDYGISVVMEDASFEPPEFRVELYDDQTLQFKKLESMEFAMGEAALLPAPAADRANLEVVVPTNARCTVLNLESGDERTIFDSEILSLPQGHYSATIQDDANRTLSKEEIEVTGGETLALKPSVARMSITRRLPGRDGLDFSESLGRVVDDPDLNLWLALLGGGRILGSQGAYSKISRFPLHDFSNEPAGASPVYVLAAFETTTEAFQVNVANSAGFWQIAEQPRGLSGVRHAYVRCHPGAKLVSFRLAKEASYTVASVTMPNRATLITVTLDNERAYYISQYLLPLGHLIDQLPPRVKQLLEYRNHLKDVHFLAQASRAFRKRRNVLREFSSSEELNQLLYVKWLDPIAAALASYELLRRGEKEHLPEVVGNMQQFFPDLPDTAALAKFAGHQPSRPNGPPLFSDGLRAFPDYAAWLPLPASHLDFTSPWTAWRTAVH